MYAPKMMIHCGFQEEEDDEQQFLSSGQIITNITQRFDYKVKDINQVKLKQTQKIRTNLTFGFLGHYGGQSNLIQRYTNNYYSQHLSYTLGPAYNRAYVQNKSHLISLNIWDFNANLKFLPAIAYRFKEVQDCAFFVYRVDDRSTFQSLEEVNAKFDVNRNSQVIKVLVGNCCDLERKISIQEAEQFRKNINAAFFMEVSGKTGRNINQLFGAAIGLLVKEKK